MIVSNITNWEREKSVYPPAINRGLDYIRAADFSGLSLGKHEIEGDLMFALLQEVTTKSWEQQRPESHRSFIDIQYLIEGEEMIRVQPLTSDVIVSEEAFEARDVAFYENLHKESALLLQPGDFTVFYPSDIHRPCCSPSQDNKIRKVVLKIHKSLLEL